MIKLHRTFTLFGLAMYLVVGNVAGQVYKCPDASGKTKFQDAPCTDGTMLTVKPASGNMEAAPHRPSATRSPGSSSDPMVGMGKNHVIQTLGAPTSTGSTTAYDGTELEWMSFTQHGKIVTVYLRSGYVYRSSTYENDRIKQRGQLTRTCPSELEIRNAETSANSITLTKAERRQQQFKIMQMKACVPY